MILLERHEWGATAPTKSRMKLPVSVLRIHHTVTSPDDDGAYESTGDVIADMREIERIGKSRFGIFSYSYAVHPSGVCGVGAGDTIGAHTADYNSTSLGIVFIGNYEHEVLTDAAVNGFAQLVAWLVATGRLRRDFTMVPHRATKQTACPGANIYAALGRLEAAARAAVNGDTTPVLPAPAAPEQAGPRNLRLTSPPMRGDDVRDWQRILVGGNYLPAGQDDGIFGKATDAATRRFQTALHLEADGVVGPRTRTAVGQLLAWLGAGAPAAAPPAFPGYARPGQTNPAVRAFQTRLAELGYRVGKIDGIYGGHTSAAMVAFQRAKGLEPDGIGGPVTWRALWT